MKNRIFALVSVLALLAFTLVPAVSAQEPLIETVCLVTDIGRVNDGTFNQYAYEGMVRAAEDFGLDDTFIETQAQADYAANLQTCIDEGYDAIVTVGFLIADATAAAAAANPDVYFIGVDQFVANPLPNYVGLQFREDQAGFLVGALAALMTESGTIAGVYGIDIPPVVKFRNGYENGARYINPDINTLGVYIDSFTAPDRGASAAEQFIGEGADVIFGAGGPTGSGGIAAAAAAGVMVIGVDQDEYFTTFGSGETPGAENLISSALKRVDNGVYDMISVLVEGGSFPASGMYVLNVNNGGISFAPAHDADVPAEVTARVEEILAGLIAGTIVTGVDPVTGAPLPSLAEVASSAGSFNTLVAAAQAAGLVDTLATGGPFTVFAPTDEAFAAALTALNISAEDLLADTETLTQILLYHVVPAAVTSDVVIGLTEVPTVQGGTISVAIVDGGVVLNDTVNVVATDIHASNGVIHVIDGVLLPPME
ncbi:BMP family ABC transporter substrate-binding protein [Oscillatoria laete-virens NRMC-F 0139]|nr:BMP family ABC transporter substrate-binding protein [Oscillatoria laete-virens]MDL5054585.1 BMP family ABC transporter substrate-binding protein [Oscillatoria laete-virens NRMC-F 0139]